ncbi:MAG: inositol monophosphatase family protein [Acidimicrobiales bacterium]
MADPPADAPSDRAADLLAAELLDLAAAAAEEAAELLVAGLGRLRTSVGAKSSATDMVTEMDTASERLIVGRLLAARPDDAVLAEEGGEQPGRSGVRWVIDPLDGTTNYLYGHPGFAVSIAAEIHGATAAAVVLDPLHGDLYRARRGGGAWRNRERLALRPPPPLAEALIATGFAYLAERRARQAAVLVGLLPEVRDIRRMGAAAVDLCSVASGRVDGYYEAGLARWDLAAGALVAEEAGAVVSGLGGAEAGPAFIVAAPPGLHRALVNALIAAGAAPEA